MRAAPLGFLIVGIVVGFAIVFTVVEQRAPTVIGARPAAVQRPEPTGAPAVDVMRVQKLQQDVRANPKNFEALTELGNINFEQRNFPEAANLYTRALELQPDNLDLRTDLGTVLFYSERVDDALREFNTVLAKIPNHPQALFNMGVALLHGKNDPQGALARWEKLVETNPTYPQIAMVKEQIKTLKEEIKK